MELTFDSSYLVYLEDISKQIQITNALLYVLVFGLLFVFVMFILYKFLMYFIDGFPEITISDFHTRTSWVSETLSDVVYDIRYNFKKMRL